MKISNRQKNKETRQTNGTFGFADTKADPSQNQKSHFNPNK